VTPSYKRAKAKVLVEWCADRLRKAFPEFNIEVPSTSAHGEDLPLDPELRKLLPVSFEMKSQKGYGHVYTDMEQTIKNGKGFTPILVAKCAHKEPIVIMRWDDWLDVMTDKVK